MKPRPTQFGVRENTASSRQHASRLLVDSVAAVSETTPIGSQRQPRSVVASDGGESLKGMPLDAATVGEKGDGSPLLTIKEVARLLRVPVSWVYSRTRKRAVDRLPGYRLGKYWRFNEDEVLAWVKSNRGGPRAA
jgi:excisionase family DNA binding protein